MRMARIEKFIPFWGEELTADTTPNESNKMFKVGYFFNFSMCTYTLYRNLERPVIKAYSNNPYIRVESSNVVRCVILSIKHY